jgi:glycosyltransferase involved in cell wall biosynthesis
MAPTFAISYVHPGFVQAEFCASLCDTLRAFPSVGLLPEEAQAGMLHLARNRAVKKFLRTGADVLVFIDSDVQWTPDDLARLLDTPHAVTGGIIGHPITSTEAGAAIYDDNMKPLPVSRDHYQRVFCFGIAFSAITRDVFDAMADRYDGPAPWFAYTDWHGRLPSEDVVFCQRLADMGVPVMVDTTIRVGHKKPIVFFVESPTDAAQV